MSHYWVLLSILHSIAFFLLSPTPPSLCTWGLSWWQKRRACFAVICLLIVDRVGRIPLPSVIPLCHWLSVALSCPPSLWVASPADGVSLSFRDSAHIRSVDHTYRVVSWQHNGQLNQCKPKLVPDWKRTAFICTSWRNLYGKFGSSLLLGILRRTGVGHCRLFF